MWLEYEIPASKRKVNSPKFTSLGKSPQYTTELIKTTTTQNFVPVSKANTSFK